jgi:xanthine dehydrogenase accessory factor
MEDTMSHSLLELAFQLKQTGKPFVLATVVRCEVPTSAKPGAQAIIQDDGQVIGWIGGSCALPIVKRESTRILREGGEPFLLRLGGATETESIQRAQSGIRAFPMACASKGVLEIYIEPHLPAPELLLIGESPIIKALTLLAPILDFKITQLDHSDTSQVTIHERTYILIATHGQYDEDVLEQVLRSPAAYIGMVSSPRRADNCRNYLRESGMEEHYIGRLKAPAGLDIGAITPEEIAASIIAELIQLQHSKIKAAVIADSQPEEMSTNIVEDTIQAAPQPIATTAIDPVCSMTVEIAHARHHTTYEGQEIYFCCPACKKAFEREPQNYLVTHER